MASIKYRIKSKSANASIYLKLSIGKGQVFEKKTGYHIHHSRWKKKEGRPINTSANEKQLSHNLKTLETYILNAVNVSNSCGDQINYDWLEHHIAIHLKKANPNNQSELVVDSIQHIIDTANIRQNQSGNMGLSQSRVNDYKALLEIFKGFQGKKKIKVSEIDGPTATKFLDYLVNKKKYSKGYSKRLIGNLKTVCYDAAFNGVEVSKQLQKIKGGKVKNEFIIYLTPEEIQKIKNTKVLAPYLENARRWLLLGCYIGQRGGDLLNLTSENIIIIDGVPFIQLIQQKTKKHVTVPIFDEAQEILDHGFPRKISTQKFNEYIKKVCASAEIHQEIEGYKFDKKSKRKVLGKYAKHLLVTSHICRRSFATNYYGKIPLHLLMRITGHSSEKSLLGYIGKSNYDYAKEAREFMEKMKRKNNKESQLSIVKSNSK